MERVDPDERLTHYWNDYVDAGRPGLRWVLAHARRSLDAARAVRGLPRVEADPADTPGGRAVREVLEDTADPGIPARVLGTAALAVPADPADYLQGRPARTLRRKIRAAESAGTTVRPVDDPAERRALLDAAEEAEQGHVDPEYRVERPDNSDLLDHELWLVAESAAGEPLLLAVAPYDGELAVLRYFRTLGWEDAHSDARYLATSALVTALSERGVRYLLDTATPPEQTNGLRHFQRMVGFRYVRLVVTGRRARSRRRAPAGS